MTTIEQKRYAPIQVYIKTGKYVHITQGSSKPDHSILLEPSSILALVEALQPGWVSVEGRCVNMKSLLHRIKHELAQEKGFDSWRSLVVNVVGETVEDVTNELCTRYAIAVGQASSPFSTITEQP